MAKKRKRKTLRRLSVPEAIGSTLSDIARRANAGGSYGNTGNDSDIPDLGAKKENKDRGTRQTATDRYDDTHAEALERYEYGYNKDRKNQDLAYEDLRFVGEDAGQWEERAKQERETEGRPILTVNKVPQFVRQVTGDIRQLRPAIKVVPVDDMASKDVAVKILPGMIRYIEQRSDAKGAYFSAADQMVAASIGHVRVYTEFAAGTTMDQVGGNPSPTSIGDLNEKWKAYVDAQREE